MLTRITISLLLFYCSHNFAETFEPLVVRYPNVEDPYARDFDAHFLELLSLGLEKSGRAFELKPITVDVMPEQRSYRMIQNNVYSVHWLNANAERQSGLKPIKIPLFKGLIGWRVLLIRTGDQARFSQITNRQELAPLSAGLGHDWPDQKVFEFNQLNKVSSPSWEGLFSMLEKGRFDYFPRSIIEYQRELRLFSHLNIELEQHLLLRYPAAYYFFVHPDNQDLAEALQIGLDKALNDGSFDKVFEKNMAQYFTPLEGSTRHIVELASPLEFPKNDRRLWWTPKPAH